MKKKLIAALLAAVMTAGVFCSCTQETERRKKKDKSKQTEETEETEESGAPTATSPSETEPPETSFVVPDDLSSLIESTELSGGILDDNGMYWFTETKCVDFVLKIKPEGQDLVWLYNYEVLKDGETVEALAPEAYVADSPEEIICEFYRGTQIPYGAYTFNVYDGDMNLIATADFTIAKLNNDNAQYFMNYEVPEGGVFVFEDAGIKMTLPERSQLLEEYSPLLSSFRGGSAADYLKFAATSKDENGRDSCVIVVFDLGVDMLGLTDRIAELAAADGGTAGYTTIAGHDFVSVKKTVSEGSSQAEVLILIIEGEDHEYMVVISGTASADIDYWLGTMGPA